MAKSDQDHWDDKYRRGQGEYPPSLPERFVPFADMFRARTSGVELACGAGAVTVWLAQQGVQMAAYDISPVAVAAATELAEKHGVADRATFCVADLDGGLPDGDRVDLIVCNLFRDARLDQAVMARLRPGGMLAVAALSEVGAVPGRFRVAEGALVSAFAALQPVASHEADGVAWLVATKSG